MVIRQRAVRVPVEGVSLRIAAASGHLVNISATGALVRATESLTPHFEYPIYLDLPADRVQLTGRVIRSSAATSEEHVRDREDYLVAVRFTALPPAASVAVARLCGTAFTLRE
jgi:c-di-GMP-binding flagellar brake protein YcgR